ncbi:MAG: hypothetical protein ACXWWT_12270 [Candidatus Deferrimicrobiaceae bacterium]
MSSVICKVNHGDFPALVALAKELGAQTIDLHNFNCSGMGGLNKEALDLSPDEWLFGPHRGSLFESSLALPLRKVTLCPLLPESFRVQWMYFAVRGDAWNFRCRSGFVGTSTSGSGRAG